MKNSQTHSRKGKIIAEKVLDFVKTYEYLKPFFALFIHYFKSILDNEKDIELKTEEIQVRTQQKLKAELLFKELWILQYICLHAWFFDLVPPKNHTELTDELLTINSALESALRERHKLDYLPWLKIGFFKHINTGELQLDKLGDFKESFPNKLVEKITNIAFECTGGRLGGELHDFVIELIMTTIQKDKKIFELNDDPSLTKY